VQRYATTAEVIITGTTVSAPIQAVTAGAAGSASAGTIIVMESSLLDSSITCSNVGNTTGADAQDDSTYRQTIQNLIEALAGATAQAVEAKAKTVTGIATATTIETTKTVIEYNIGTGATIGTWFTIPKSTLYIADGTGAASDALIAEVLAAIASVKAAGVVIDVRAATAVTVNWTTAMTLNPTGPNYAELSASAQKILDSKRNYINTLPIGTSFVRATANAAILAIWGPSGTNDLTAFTTSVPSGDVAATASQKMVAGTMSQV
jgi:hypothetical protein